MLAKMIPNNTRRTIKVIKQINEEIQEHLTGFTSLLNKFILKLGPLCFQGRPKKTSEKKKRNEL